MPVLKTSSFYYQLTSGFNSCHNNHANVLMHLFTSFGFYVSVSSFLKIALVTILNGSDLQGSIGSDQQNITFFSSSLSYFVSIPIPTLANWLGVLFWILYACAVLAVTSFTVSLLSIVLIAGAIAISFTLNLSLFYAALLFAASYLLQVENIDSYLRLSFFMQDLSHFLTSEPTFQSQYTPGAPNSPISSWSQFYHQLFLHSFFMLPLVIESAINISLAEAVLSWFLV